MVEALRKGELREISLKEALQRITRGRFLTAQDASALFEQIISDSFQESVAVRVLATEALASRVGLSMEVLEEIAEGKFAKEYAFLEAELEQISEQMELFSPLMGKLNAYTYPPREI